MVKLRLKRMGSKFNAFYRIVAADARAPRDGRFIEEVGYYNPHSKETFVNTELRTKWEKEGAVASTTVKNLFKKYDKAASKGTDNGVVTLEVKPKKVKQKEVKVEEVATEAAAETTEAPAEEVKSEETTEVAAETTEAPAEEVKSEETTEAAAEETTTEE